MTWATRLVGILVVVCVARFAIVYASVDDTAAQLATDRLSKQCQNLVPSESFCHCFADRVYRNNVEPSVAKNRSAVALSLASFGVIDIPESVRSEIEDATSHMSSADTIAWGLGCALRD